MIIVFCFGSLLLVHAQPSLTTTIDKNEILIGEQVKLKVTATLPAKDYFIKWLDIPDSLEHFEVIEKSKIDSSFTHQKLTGLVQTITFTSFDSGKWVLPVFNIDCNPSLGDSAFNLYTDSIPITVTYLADTTNTLKDIKTIREVEDEIPFWYWIAAALALLFLILITGWLYNRYKKRKKQLPLQTSLSAYEQAMLGLDQLKLSDLSSPLGIKQFHSRLTGILKNYLAVKQGIDYGSSTTSDVLVLLDGKGFDKTMLSAAAAALRCSDAVKFAKYLPEKTMSEETWYSVKHIIEKTEQQSNH